MLPAAPPRDRIGPAALHGDQPRRRPRPGARPCARRLWTATGNPMNGTGLPANCWPNYGPQPGIPAPQTMWAADGRAGGAPDPRQRARPDPDRHRRRPPAGAGGDPATPVNYEQNVRSITSATSPSTASGSDRPSGPTSSSTSPSSPARPSSCTTTRPRPPRPLTRASTTSPATGTSPRSAARRTPSRATVRTPGPSCRSSWTQTAPNTSPFSLTALKSGVCLDRRRLRACSPRLSPRPSCREPAYNSAYNATFPLTHMRAFRTITSPLRPSHR